MKKFLCYDTNDAATGKIPVNSNGVLKPTETTVFYVSNADNLIDAKGEYIPYEQAKAAGLNCIIKFSNGAMCRPISFHDYETGVGYEVVEHDMDGNVFIGEYHTYNRGANNVPV